MTEHFDFDLTAARSADIFVDYGLMDFLHAVERKLARKHHRVSKLRIKADGFDVGNIALSRDVNFDSTAAGIAYGRDVGGDDGAYACLAGRIYDAVHLFDVVIVDYNIDCQICAHTGFVADGHNTAQVVEIKIDA